MYTPVTYLPQGLLTGIINCFCIQHIQYTQSIAQSYDQCPLNTCFGRAVTPLHHPWSLHSPLTIYYCSGHSWPSLCDRTPQRVTVEDYAQCTQSWSHFPTV